MHFVEVSSDMFRLKEDGYILQQDLLQLFCIFLSMPLPTDERFFLREN